MKQNTVLLSSHYFPCVEWFRYFLSAERILIEQHEHFLKQTYRSRTVILSANGKLALSVPVSRIAHKTAVKDMLIDNSVKWRHQHFEAIRSAYNSSPYFMYYAHHFEKFFNERYESLLQLNMASVELILQLLKQQKQYNLTSEYIIKTDVFDTRELIHPKRKSEAEFRKYLQVFAAKFPFQENLSVLDVLFNNGTDATQYILS